MPIKFSALITEPASIGKRVAFRCFNLLVSLITKQPPRPPLSWESIIGDKFVKKPEGFVAGVVNLSDIPRVNQQLMELPSDILNDLLLQIQINKIDEIKLIRLYEKLFACEIQIQPHHIHSYKCTSKEGSETIDYTNLKSRLIKIFSEHKEFILSKSL